MLKQLRCSGKKTGCTRCVATRISCVYSGNKDGKSVKRRCLAAQTRDREILTPRDTSEDVPPSSGSSQLPTFETSKESDGKDAQDSIKAVERHGDNDEEKEGEIDVATSEISSNQCDSAAWNLDDESMITDDMVRDMLSESKPRNFEDLIAIGRYTLPTDLGSDQFLSYNSMWLDASNTPPPTSKSLYSAGPFPKLGVELTFGVQGSSHMASWSTQSSHLQSDSLPTQKSRDHRKMQTFTLPDTASRDSDSLPKTTSCGCLQLVVSLLGDLETKSNYPENDRLDSILAFHKEALKQCTTMLLCSHCTSRSENMMLLAIVGQKLASLCETIVIKHQQQSLSPSQPITESSSSNKPGGISPGSTTKYRGQVFFGDYEVDDCFEWECLIRSLIMLQLRSLRYFLSRMKMVAFSTLTGTQLKTIEAAERRLGNVLEILRQ
jgi:hypothetical protein